MSRKGILDEIKERLLNGEKREDLNNEYNKSTVSRVYNKLEKEGLLKIGEEEGIYNNKEEDILNLLKEALNLINDGEEYKIDISISKKNMKNLKKITDENEMINPFVLYNNSSKELMEKELKSKSKDSMICIIKKYFKYNNKMLKKSKDELAKYICLEVEKVLNIGKCFK